MIPATRETPEELFYKDEPIRRDTSQEKMAKLPAVFKEGGSVTAGNACSMSEGGNSLILMSKQKAKALEIKPLFSLVSYASGGVENAYMGEGPGVAIPKALEKACMELGDVELIEVNEVFAAQILANERVLGWDRSTDSMFTGELSPWGIPPVKVVRGFW